MKTIVLSAALGIAEHLPGCVELEDPMRITTGVGVVLLRESPIRRLQLCGTRGDSHPQHLIRVTGGTALLHQHNTDQSILTDD